MTLPATIAARAVLASDRTAWLAVRGIGGSDVAAIRGTPGAYQTAWDVWVAHQPGVDRVERADPLLEEGRLWESIALGLYANATGRHVIPAEQLARELGTGDYVVLRHPEFPWATGSPDGLVLDAGETGGIEAKTWRGDHGAWGVSGTVLDAPDPAVVPAPYLDQVYWYLEITGLPWWDVVVLLPRPWGMPELRWYRVLRNVEHQRAVLDEVRAWKWTHAPDYRIRDGWLAMHPGAAYRIGRSGPMLEHPGHAVRLPEGLGPLDLQIGHEPPSTGDRAERAWRDRTGATKRPARDATRDEAALIARLRFLRDRRDADDAECRQIEAELAQLFGEETYAIRGAGFRCTRVASRSAPRVDYDLIRERLPEAIKAEGTPYRKFLITTPKEKR